MSGVSSSCRVLAKIQTWLAPMAIAPRPKKYILHADDHTTEEVVDFIVQRRDVDLVNQSYLKVILEILSHTREVAPHRYPKGLKKLAGSDTGELQDLRRTDGTGGQNDLPTRRKERPVAFSLSGIGDADDTGFILVVKEKRFNEGVGANCQIGASSRWIEIGDGGRTPQAVFRR